MLEELIGWYLEGQPKMQNWASLRILCAATEWNGGPNAGLHAKEWVKSLQRWGVTGYILAIHKGQTFKHKPASQWLQISKSKMSSVMPTKEPSERTVESVPAIRVGDVTVPR